VTTGRCRKSGTDFVSLCRSHIFIEQSSGFSRKMTLPMRLLFHAFSGGLEMLRVMAGLVLCVGLAATASAQEAKVAQGEKLIADQKCTLCHSIADKGNKKGPLDGVGAKLKADEIREWIVDAKGMTAKTKATRKPEMKAYALPKDDVDALVAYLSTLKK
jgi:mono/diheme cytochrome c family protein